MQKGFSLVELSIVLVIVGILMGMTLKGKELIESARVTEELTKYRKAEIAIASFLANNDDTLPQRIVITNANSIPLSELKNYGFSSKDANSRYSKYPYGFHVCTIVANSTSTVELPFESTGPFYGIKHTSNTGMICISPIIPTTGWVAPIKSMMYCHAELRLDDKSRFTGRVRFYNRETSTIPADYFDSCKKQTGDKLMAYLVWRN